MNFILQGLGIGIGIGLMLAGLILLMRLYVSLYVFYIENRIIVTGFIRLTAIIVVLYGAAAAMRMHG